MVFCNQCGEQITGSVYFCPNCGTKVVKTESIVNNVSTQEDELKALEARRDIKTKGFAELNKNIQNGGKILMSGGFLFPILLILLFLDVEEIIFISVFSFIMSLQIIGYIAIITAANKQPDKDKRKACLKELKELNKKIKNLTSK